MSLFNASYGEKFLGIAENAAKKLDRAKQPIVFRFFVSKIANRNGAVQSSLLLFDPENGVEIVTEWFTLLDQKSVLFNASND